MEDRRTLRRFNLKLACRIWAHNRHGGQDHYEVVTDNISSGGAYFATYSPFRVGTRLNIRIMIQRSNRSGPCSDRSCVSICGEVVRTDASGVAVEFDDQYLILQVASGVELRCEAENSGIASAGGIETCSAPMKTDHALRTSVSNR